MQTLRAATEDNQSLPVVVEAPEHQVVRPLLAAATKRKHSGIGLAAEVLQGALAARLKRPHLRVLARVLDGVDLRATTSQL